MTVLDQLYELQEFDIKNNFNIITENDVNVLIEHSQSNWVGFMRINIADYPIRMWLNRTINTGHKFKKEFYATYTNIMKLIDLKERMGSGYIS